MKSESKTVESLEPTPSASGWACPHGNFNCQICLIDDLFDLVDKLETRINKLEKKLRKIDATYSEGST